MQPEVHYHDHKDLPNEANPHPHSLFLSYLFLLPLLIMIKAYSSYIHPSFPGPTNVGSLCYVHLCLTKHHAIKTYWGVEI
jgi:hypothetical protein